ncbi:adenylosuccinate synthetase [Spiroplasma eriocheiris]|uniref:Adenylosuccinate synthetase n=1 Tax=Spiroplasma eriocheiris TaxID=315358 RepID=A0A0H3XLX9_9MOLU|nr:adenylosuccinate synthase [Spiroplasma eriocheiris]AHF57381.1 adenylosuccinate synthetase [Spiroplasma eriocheiris CCTCC M 207170]AKM53837.1 adenylosuccinate synthetase [Spiroplasma eriocheiris]
MQEDKIRTLAVVGSQWGDEGKGKITDYFAQSADYVVRWAGGDNAGHTIVIDGKKYKLSIVPSGVFNANSMNVIANGCVVNLRKLVSEINYLAENGYDCKNLRISNRAHLILPYHLKIDELQEEYRQDDLIGTTKKGVGPCYQDKAERIGIRVGDLFEPENFKKRLTANLKFKNELLTKIFNAEPFTVQEIYDEYLELFNQIKDLVTDTSLVIDNAIKVGKKVLFEGAQGVMLDLDHGTYPFVTSSNPSAASIPTGCGIAPRYISNVIGIVKAYNTRVGTGPFPSEITGEVADYIRETGHEYGTVSGRARRIGWFDAVLMKHSLRVSGYTSMAIMLLDVLTSLDKIKICTKYRYQDQEIDYVPSTIAEYNQCQPIFMEVDGWTEDISQVKTYEELPTNAKKYLAKLSEIVGVPISLFSVGPDRAQTILIDKEIF